MKPKSDRQIKADMERERYMRHEISHHEYFCWLADFVGATDSMIPFTEAEVAASQDPEHLNDLPLPRWDKADPLIRSRTIAWSLSDTVCCLKAMARRRRDRKADGER